MMVIHKTIPRSGNDEKESRANSKINDIIFSLKKSNACEEQAAGHN